LIILRDVSTIRVFKPTHHDTQAIKHRAEPTPRASMRPKGIGRGKPRRLNRPWGFLESDGKQQATKGQARRKIEKGKEATTTTSPVVEHYAKERKYQRCARARIKKDTREELQEPEGNVEQRQHKAAVVLVLLLLVSPTY